jgi:hypothetical protein
MPYDHLAQSVSFADVAPLFAGMPSVTLTDAASLRFQSISFFLVVFAIASLIIRWLWNSLRSEFPRLPHLSYPKALGLVGLWGLLFLLVLTMISGARELMTPGAWKKDGITYTLDDGKMPASDSASSEPTEGIRREKLHALFAALAAYALRHNGRYPPEYDSAISADLWKTPHASGKRYLYRPALANSDAGQIVAYEPDVFGDGRFVLFASGEVKRMTSAELDPLLVRESRP